MSIRNRLRGRLLYNGEKDWDKAISIAIGPNWLRGIKFKVDAAGRPLEGPAMKIFSAYLEVVCKSRESGISMPAKGTRSLQATAFECVMNAIPRIEELGDLPGRIIDRLWREMNRRSVISLHAWKILLKALHPIERVNMLRYRQEFKHPEDPLQAYIGPLTSNTFDFITALTITVEFPVPELVKVSQMKNLGILHLARPFPSLLKSEVSDTLVRAWSRTAMDDGAFPVLRVLRLWDFEDVTDVSLQYISRFPALALFDMRGCGFVDYRPAAENASRLGWRMCTPDPLGDFDGLCYENSVDSQQYPRKWRPRRRESKPFWDGLKVHRIQRAEVQKFLSRPSIKTSRDPHTLPPDSKHRTEDDNLLASLDWKLFLEKGNFRDRNFENYMAWNRIGELVDDRDLVSAGVQGIEEQTFVASQLITPVPMAMILLGPAKSGPSVLSGDKRHGSERSPKSETKSTDQLVFIRVSNTVTPAFFASVTADITTERVPVKRKRPGESIFETDGRIKESKKLRLEELINSFY